MAKSCVLLLLLSFQLSGCGSGSGSGNSAPVVINSPSPTPTASATPSATYNSIANPTGTFDIPLSTVFAGYVGTNVNTALRTEYRGFESTAAKLTISSIGTYSFAYPAYAQTFGPSDLNPNRTFLGPAFKTYEKLKLLQADGSEKNDTLVIYRPDGGSATPPRAFTYTTVGQAVFKTFSANLSRSENVGIWFAGGVRTLSSDVPGSGVQSATGPATADLSRTIPVDALSGSLSCSTNFATGEARYQIILSSTSFPSTVLQGNAFLNANRTGFDGTISGGGYNGTISGAFNGPKAGELGVSFNLNDTSGNSISGVAAC